MKRILYQNPDAEFVFCAGDDKVCTFYLLLASAVENNVCKQTDEDMFRALQLFPPGTTEAAMNAPLSISLVNGNGNGNNGSHDGKNSPPASYPPVNLTIRPEAVFTTAVGHSSKRTLAGWHVTTPQEVVEHMLELVGERDDGASRSSHL